YTSSTNTTLCSSTHTLSLHDALPILLVEDSEADAHLILRLLRKGGYEPIFQRVQTAAEMKAALQAHPWDLVLADYNLPQFDAPRSEEHTSELQSRVDLVCRLLLEKKK